MITQNSITNTFFQDFATTILYILILLLGRYFLERSVRTRKMGWSEEQKLKTIGTVRSAMLGLLIFGVIYIWANELRDFVVSVFAIAVAIVLALKELILCMHGYILLIRNHAYQLGDRIEINGWRGDVVNIGLLSTTLMEVGHGKAESRGQQKTGRAISFPNSMLLTHFVVNESFLENFTLLMVQIPLKLSQDWARAKAILLEVAQEQCAPFLEKAQRMAKERASREGITVPSVEPTIFIHLPAHKKIDLKLRVACPMHLRDACEQSILSAFLERFSRL